MSRSVANIKINYFIDSASALHETLKPAGIAATRELGSRLLEVRAAS
jgi:hypothetical protein